MFARKRLKKSCERVVRVLEEELTALSIRTSPRPCAPCRPGARRRIFSPPRRALGDITARTLIAGPSPPSPRHPRSSQDRRPGRRRALHPRQSGRWQGRSPSLPAAGPRSAPRPLSPRRNNVRRPSQTPTIRALRERPPRPRASPRWSSWSRACVSFSTILNAILRDRKPWQPA